VVLLPLRLPRVSPWSWKRRAAGPSFLLSTAAESPAWLSAGQLDHSDAARAMHQPPVQSWYLNTGIKMYLSPAWSRNEEVPFRYPSPSAARRGRSSR